MRKHGKVDGHQSSIVSALRRVGASVTILASVGEGTPDLLVGFRGRTYVIELKEKGNGLTPDQERWWQAFRGEGAVVFSEEEALRVIGAINGK